MHVGLLGCSPALFDVALGARAHNICPGRRSAHAPRDDVVQGKLARREAFAAILATVLVACEDVSPIELNFRPRQPVVEEQPNDPRHCDMKIHRRYPIVPVRLELPTKLTYLAPTLKIVI